MKKLIIISIISVFLIVTLVFDITQNSNTQVLSINGETISKEEFNMFLIDNKATTISYFYNKYNIDSSEKNFWNKEVDGQTPLQMLIDETIDDIVRNKVQQQEAIKYGIINAISYEELVKACEDENKSREKAKQEGEIIYGPIQYDIKQYYSYYFSTIPIELMTKLSKEVLVPTKEELINHYNQTKGKQYETETSGDIDFFMIEDNSKFDESKISEIFKFVRNQLENKIDSQTIINSVKTDYNIDIHFKSVYVNQKEVGKEDTNYQRVIDTLYTLNVGDISDIIALKGYIGIFEVKQKPEIAMKSFEEVEDIVKKDYISIMYQQYINKLIEEAEIKVSPHIEKLALSAIN